MPVVRFEVKNEYGLADPQLYGSADRDDPEALLEGVAMAGLVGLLRQLGDLAEFAAGIFHNLHEEVMTTSARGHSLTLRVQQLEAEVPAMEKAVLSQTRHVQAVYNTGTEWHPNSPMDQNLVTRGDMPRLILDSYEECRGPPRLFMLDKFDVAGAGACLKRYSDPSFFKTDLASSGAMEPEIQREKRTRKCKKKLLQLRNGENFEPPLDPHVAILNHMQSEKAPPNMPAKRVKLKTRTLNCRDTASKSYMECTLERYIPGNDVSCRKTVEYSPLQRASADSTAPVLGVSVATDVSSIGSLPLNSEQIKIYDVQGVDGPSNEGSMHEAIPPLTNEPMIANEMQGAVGQCSEEGRKEEASQVTDKPFPSNEVEQPTQTSECPCRNKDFEGETFLEPAREISVESKAKASPADIENKSDGGSDVYVSDDVASEADNFMDALATIDSEIESESENKPKPQLGSSNIEAQLLSSEPGKDEEMQSHQLLDFDLSENNNFITVEISNFANKDSLHVPLGSSFQEDEVESQKKASSELCSVLVDVDSLHPSNSQSSQVDAVQIQAHEDSDFFSYSLQTNLVSLSDGENAMITEEGSNQVVKISASEIGSTMPFCDIEPSSSSVLTSSSTSFTHPDSQGCGADQTTIATLGAVGFDAIDANKLSEQSYFNPGNSSSAILVSNKIVSADDEGACVLVNHPDSDFGSLQDNMGPLPRAEESPAGVTFHGDVSDASQEQLVDCGCPPSIANARDTPLGKACPENVLAQSSPGSEMLNSDYADCAPSLNERSLFDSREMESCQSETHETHSISSEAISFANAIKDALIAGRKSLDASTDAMIAEERTRTAVSGDEDLEGSRSKSPARVANSSANKNQASTEDGLFPQDAAASEQPTIFSTENTLLEPQGVLSNAFSIEDTVPVDFSRDQPLLPSEFATSEPLCGSALTITEHAFSLDSVSKFADSKDNTFDEHRHSISDISKDGEFLDASQKYEPENDEQLCPSRDLMNTYGYPSSQIEECQGTCILPSDRTYDCERIFPKSDTKSPAVDKDLVAEKLDCTLLSTSLADTSEPSELESRMKHDLNGEALSGRHFRPLVDKDREEVSTSGKLGITEDIYPEKRGIAAFENHEEPCHKTMTLARESTEPDLTRFHECIESLDNGVQIADSQVNVAENASAHLPSPTLVDSINGNCPINQLKQIEGSNLCDTFEIAARICSESSSKQTMEDGRHSTELIQLHPDCISSEPSCEIESSSEFNIPTGLVHIVDKFTSHASCDLVDTHATAVLLQNSTIDGANEIPRAEFPDDETHYGILSGEGNADPFVSSPKPVTDTMGNTSKSDESLYNVTISNRQVCSEANISINPETKISTRPLEVSLQTTPVPHSSTGLPEPDSVHVNTSEPLNNGLFNFPMQTPTSLQSDLDNAPPLPPLPPLQWRIGKPKPFSSSAAASQPISGSNAFASMSIEENLKNNPEATGLGKQGMDAFKQLTGTANQSSYLGLTAIGEGSTVASHGHTSLIKQAGGSSYQEENAQTRPTDVYDAKGDDSSHCPKALQEETGSLDSFAPVLLSSEVDIQHHSSLFDKKQIQLSEQSVRLPVPGFGESRDNAAIPQSIPMELHFSNPFIDMPLVMDPRYPYGYRFVGGDNLQSLATQGINPHHGFYVPLGENVYGSYPMTLAEMEALKSNGRPLSILNRPRDPLIEAVASHDKSTLRKVSEMVQTSAKPKDEERNTMLDQIKQKSFSLKRTIPTRPSVKGPTTNLKVAAILEKAKAMRQACAGSDDEDNWSDC